MDEAEKQIGDDMSDQRVAVEINLTGDFTEKVNAAVEAMERFSEVIRPFVQGLADDEIIVIVKDARSRGVDV